MYKNIGEQKSYVAIGIATRASVFSKLTSEQVKVVIKLFVSI